MIKKRKVMSLFLTLAMITTSFTLPTLANAVEKTRSVPEKQITFKEKADMLSNRTGLSKKRIISLAEETIEKEDYVEGELLVVLKKQYSSYQAEFKITDFPEITATKVENLTYCNNPESELISDDFRTILSVTIKQKTDKELLNSINVLMTRKDVETVSLDVINEAETTQTVPPSDTKYKSQWGLDKIDVMGAWSKTTGSTDVRVGIIDSGIDYAHNDLASSMWKNPGEIPGDGIDNDGNGYIDDVYGWNCINDNGNVMDSWNHGTLVAGVIAANINTNNVVGIAPGVKLVALKVGESRETYSVKYAIKAIKYATDNGIDILNYSVSNPKQNDAFDYGINNYKGIFVASAGNYSQNNDINPRYPKAINFNNVIKVAATDLNDSLCSFSSYGALDVALAAPGEEIVSTFPNNFTALVDGTSFSAPYVSGVAALIKSQYPGFSSSMIIDCIKKGVDKLDNLTGKVETGGRLNANKAMEAARYRSGRIPSVYNREVDTFDELKDAMENEICRNIIVNSDIELQGEITMTKSKTFYGGAKLIGNGERHFIIDGEKSIYLNLGGMILENGGIENRASDFNLTGSGAVIRNSNRTQGGAIYNSGNMKVTDMRIENCSAADGGGIYNSGTLTISNTTIFNNQATLGGAVYTSGTINISGGIIKMNVAENNGGGIFGYSNSHIIVDNLPQVIHNTAMFSGGGIYTSGQLRTQTTDGLNVAFNNAKNGGGIYGETGAEISLAGRTPGKPYNITIGQNEASDDGAGIFLNTGASLYLDNAYIAANKAGGIGNGMLIKGDYTKGGYVMYIDNDVVLQP